MDLKAYYRTVREIEAGITQAHVVAISLATPDGGRAGVAIEVSRSLAARLIGDGKARLANEQEAAAHRAELAEAKRIADQAILSQRLQFTVLSEADLKTLKGNPRPGK